MTQKITKLVSSGITDIVEVKRHLHFYATKTVPKELGIHPKPNSRACISFYYSGYKKPHIDSKEGIEAVLSGFTILTRRM